MVGIVIVSHSEKLASGVLDATKIMADGCPVAIAGGADDGGYGTSYEKIRNAIESVYSKSGVIVLVDMGSAVMTAEMVIEDMGYGNVLLVDCPIAEGAIAASVASFCGDGLEEVKNQALSAKTEAKW
ncbi:MAG: PTS-dependent dihydroxyacetone kinase phosphotransferase subunit DhaM [Clostridia bacterium]|nr:PTS-dependent dihydroxyacetone kinase phosphotransferase subunit DhaM [Clostridia bacterium]